MERRKVAKGKILIIVSVVMTLVVMFNYLWYIGVKDMMKPRRTITEDMAYMFEKDMEDLERIITPEDVAQAMQETAEMTDITMNTFDRLYKRLEELGILGFLENLGLVDTEEDVSADDYEWLLDYNLDGVKDYLDYYYYKQYVERE